MPSLFAKPPSPPPLPKMAPPTNTPLTAELSQMAKRQGEAAAVASPPGARAGRGKSLTHTLTG